MKKSEFIKYYWNNYILIENKFLSTEKYISIEKDNSAAYSLEYLNLFLLLCNEYDAITSELCNHFEGKAKQRNVCEKTKILMDNVKNFNNLKANIKDSYNEFQLVPFKKFSENSSSEWWQSYNNIKHNRSGKDNNGKPNYYKANLKNVLFALSAVYIISSKFYEVLEDDNGNHSLTSEIFLNVQ